MRCARTRRSLVRPRLPRLTHGGGWCWLRIARLRAARIGAMNRDKLSSLAPTDRAFREMNGTQKNDVVVEFALQVLQEISAAGREPDAWESVHLMHALGALYGERLTYALTLIELAIEDPVDRAPD